ncbi:MAG: hypothetical protein HC767_05040 [Akkermansiaceae bacterium]|nr:hypothetical protein [Akkermansiaceae bacterium]
MNFGFNIRRKNHAADLPAKRARNLPEITKKHSAGAAVPFLADLFELDDREGGRQGDQ